jgi:hypothetical protein
VRGDRHDQKQLIIPDNDTLRQRAGWRDGGRAGHGLPLVVALAALGLGAVACAYYAAAGLQLSHYDARSHLVVARRVFDSITPGWLQIGAVWLPLPHLLNLLPVQIDALYRTGASAILISMVAFGVTAFACSRLILDATASRVAAVAGAAVVVTNPNVLYLQATPMTEPLLMALTTGAVLALGTWIARNTEWSRRAAAWLFAAACLTRYEAWPVTAAALAIAVVALVRLGRSWRDAVRAVLPLAGYPAAAVIAFLVLSRVTVGAWLVSTGFFIPDNTSLGRPVAATLSVLNGATALCGHGPMVLAAAGLLILVVGATASRAGARPVVMIALAGAAALPLYAFVIGHPFRVRYMVPLIPAVATLAGVAVGSAGRARVLLGTLLVASMAIEARPFDPRAPMVLEAQWDLANARGRQAVTACLARDYRGEKIMASMGSLAHYMQELSHEGFALREFLHEGNGDIWLAALHGGPRWHVGWVLIEEQAEGGDLLAVRSRATPRFLEGFTRVCEGGGVALYRREAPLRTDSPRTAR